MRSFSVIFLVFSFVLTALAQDGGPSVRGIVSGPGGVIEGAVVTITSSKESAIVKTITTNSAGEFSFNVLPGRYVIWAESLLDGRSITSEPADITVQLGKVTPVTITLGGTPLLRESVTIAADHEQPLDQVSKTVNVISGAEMRDRADYTLADSLRTIPGFRVQQLGGFGRTASIKTRGLRNHDTALLIDGVRFRDAAAINGDATSFLADMNLTSVRRIEVMRGSGSSLYGTNATGGTVNFITPKTAKGWHGQIAGNYGGYGFGRFRGIMSYGSDDGRFGLNLGVSRTAFTKGIDGNDNASNTTFQPKIDIKLTDKTDLSVRFYITDASVRLNSSPDTIGTLPALNNTIIDAREGTNFIFDVDDPDSIQRSKSVAGVFSLSHSISSELSVNGYYSGLKTKRRNDNGILGVGWQSETTTYNDGLIQTINGGFSWTPGVHTVRAGYEFEHEKYGNDGFTPSGTEDFSTRAFQASHSLFAQDVMGLFEGRLQLAGGVRAQWFDLKSPTFSNINAPFGSFTLSSPEPAYTFDGAASYYFPSSGTKLRVHAGSGYRVPSLYERFGSYFSTWPSPGFVALGDPNLEPEKTFAFDAAIEQDLFSGRARLTATYFYTTLIDTIGYGSLPLADPHGRSAGYLNNKGGISRGGEFSIEAKASSSTDIFASYTYTNSDQNEPQVAGSGIFRSLAIPDHQFTMSATQRFGQFWINGDVLVSSSYLAPIFSNTTFGTYVYRFDGNRRMDLTAGYSFKFNDGKFSLRPYATVENLFGNEYYENGFRTPGRNGRIGLNLSF